MIRKALDFLLNWKNDPTKKPLLIKGVRQVGKTWLVDIFGKQNFKNYIYINFEKSPQLHKTFEGELDAVKIIGELETIYSTKIDKNTLVFFDEIQSTPRAFSFLRFFNNSQIKTNLICAGSLLGTNLMKNTFVPAGDYIEYYLYPLSFEEYLDAKNLTNLSNFVKSIENLEPINLAILEKIQEVFREYLYVGGMPNVINNWLSNYSKQGIEQSIEIILNSYYADINIYCENSAKVYELIHNIPTQLSKENSKFMFNKINENARKREYESSLDWLLKSNLFYKVFKAKTIGIPLNGLTDFESFKVYIFDIGVLRYLANLDFGFLDSDSIKLMHFIGSYYENYVLNSLLTQFETRRIQNYWSTINPNYEVDFLLQYRNNIIPIEVKSSTNVKSTSLNFYGKKYESFTPLKVRYSGLNLTLDNNLLNIPLCLADWSKHFIDLAFDKLKIK